MSEPLVDTEPSTQAAAAATQAVESSGCGVIAERAPLCLFLSSLMCLPSSLACFAVSYAAGVYSAQASLPPSQLVGAQMSLLMKDTASLSAVVCNKAQGSAGIAKIRGLLASLHDKSE
jgi:hypothetical protein